MEADLIAWAVMFVAGLGTSAVLALRQRRRKAALPPVSTIASAKPGQVVRLVGTIVEGATVNAPITGRACVCFNAALHPLIQARDKRTWGEPLIRVGGSPFVVEDGTGRIEVDPGGLVIRAQVDHHAVEKVRGGFILHDPTMLPDWVHFDELVIDEGVMQVGARVVLEGVVERPSDGPDAAVFRAGASPQAVLTASRDRAASVSNLPPNVEDAAEALRVAPGILIV